MDRALAPPPGPPTVDVIPPPDPAAVLRVGLAGLGLSAAAAAGGLAAAAVWGDSPAVWDGAPLSGDIPWPVHTARLILVAAGALLAGSAVSMRGTLWRAWLIAAGTALLAAVAGLPDHWDSARLVARVAAAGCAAGAGLAFASRAVACSVASLAVAFHFGGILTAATWPDPSPWLTNQMAERVYLPYLSFLYLRNAYHFYSPEPGPANLLYALVRYEVDGPPGGKPEVVHEWYVMPDRHRHMADPLGLGYYRRLSITEMATGTVPDPFVPAPMKAEAQRRRAAVALGAADKERIPPAPPEIEPEVSQYRVPRPDVSRYVLPSYVRHLAAELTAPGRRVAGLKVYRVEHKIPPVQLFKDGFDPYSPVGYRPFFLGDFDPAGTLLNPDDPMLYWLVPVVPKPGGVAPGDPDKRDYLDFLGKHAGFEPEWRRP